MVGVEVVPCSEHIGGIVHISLRITDSNYTYISQRITGHLEAGESRRAVSDKALYIALRLYISSSKTLEIWNDIETHRKGPKLYYFLQYIIYIIEFVVNIFRTYGDI
jgi:hypothetical protein